jgi:hypothetical protein
MVQRCLTLASTELGCDMGQPRSDEKTKKRTAVTR